MNYTPGPWQTDCFDVRQAETGAIVAKSGPAYGMHAADRLAANARLIAAAPALLAELLAAVQHEEDSLHMSEEHIYVLRKEWLPRAKAALVKAGQIDGHSKS